MRLVTYSKDGAPRAALVRGAELVDLNVADAQLPAGMNELLALGPAGIELVRRAAERGRAFPRAGVQLLAPVPRPQKVICVGLNYADHARETGKPLPEEPVFFSKFPTAITAHEADIRLPAVSSKVDYEAELVAVIGLGGRNIPAASALDHVAGYACGHDVSARDWQTGKPGGQWLLGKSFDTFAPLGPELVTPDEVGDAGNLKIELRINGQTMQSSSTRELIFPIAELVAYVSQVCTLVPGDVIFTGTPAGVGVARKPPVYLKPGDVVEIEIEKVGLLRNRVVADGPAG